MAERLKKRRFNALAKQLDEERIGLEEAMPDEMRFTESVLMPYKLRLVLYEFGLGVLDMAAGKKDEVCVNIPRAGKLEIKMVVKE